ncbi:MULTISPECIES: LysE family translocator [Pseudomonas]|uniref:Translocator protein, LysE family n=1 Tax=Pseudomonas fluorescens (strain Q2-87) TaxID=1038922 RepID=J2ENP5_PSEFQ|nr:MULTISPECIES: LysE family translocator [Pseudomonas]EJL05280.1 translocator protein, LysE family [Pseudomonas fluorescens Q2-87]
MAELWLFLMALTVAFLLPGPDMIVLLQTGARRGRGAALATAVGLGIARGCHVALAALGLSALFKTAPWTFDLVRLAGAAYLMWIGFQCLRTPLWSSFEEREAQTGKHSGYQAIRRGLLTNLLNPKALLFCSVLLPQFIAPTSGPVLEQFAILGVVLVSVGFLFDSAYALVGVALGRWIQRSPSAQRVQQWLFGSLLIGFAVRLTFVQQS